MLVDLFQNAYAAYFNSLPKNEKKDKVSITVRSEVIFDAVFDLMDKETTIKQDCGKGCVTYHNISGFSILVIDYEKMMNDLGELAHGIKRCDFVCCQDKNGKLFFIMNELSTGDPTSKWPDARVQFIHTLKYLSAIDSIWQLIKSFKFKYCIVSCRRPNISSPSNMAQPFSIPYSLLREVQEKKYKPINKYGFKIFEATHIYISEDNIDLRL